MDKIKESGGQGFDRESIALNIKIGQLFLLFKEFVLYVIIAAFFSMIFSPILVNIISEIGFEFNLTWTNMWFILLIIKGFITCLDVGGIFQQDFIFEEGGIEENEQ